LKVYYDAEGKTLTVWFDDPEKQFVAKEVGDEGVCCTPLSRQKSGNYLLASRAD